MFVVVPKAIWSIFGEPYGQNATPPSANFLRLRHCSTNVLVETRFGNKWSDKERGFYDLEHRTVVDALHEIDLDPADINSVIVTHLHFDHAAGLTSKKHGSDTIVPTFPNAKIFVQQTEWNDAPENKST